MPTLLKLVFAALVAAAFLSHPANAQSTADIPAVLQQLLNAPDAGHRDSVQVVENLRAAYALNGMKPLWLQGRRPSAQAVQIVQELQAAEDVGLSPADYQSAVLAEQLHALQAGLNTERSLEFDVGLSAAAVRFVEHLHYGRIDPAKAGFHFDAPRAPLNRADILLSLSRSRNLPSELHSFEPRFNHYALLKAALVRYRQLAIQTLPSLMLPGGKSLKPGEAYAGLSLLRERLSMLGDLPASAINGQGTVLDDVLAGALRSFQERHGLTPDGVLGARTVDALNTPLTQRVRQIELTLERWRWLPQPQDRMIVVNIPQFRLFAFQSADDSENGMLNMEVVVGQAFRDKRTPVFVDEIQHLIFRPYWDVPYNITQREILPAVRRNPDYLAKNHMEIVHGQGDRSPVLAPTSQNLELLRTGEARVRQMPGADNALGEIKFMLPNPFNVYLHSTPAKELFKQSRRAFSHGCIRVSNPMALALYALRDTPGEWNEETVRAWMDGEPNRRVNLARPIPVMILYGTAVAGESGRVFFFDDIYGYDRALQDLLGR